MATYIGYLVRDMKSNCPNKNPYKDFTNAEVVRTHLSAIEESLCTFEGDLKSLRDEDTLKEIIEATRESTLLKTLFPDLLAVVIKFSKRKVPLENGKRIYVLYRINLFRDITESTQPDGAMFDCCIAMVTTILTDGSELDEAKQDMLKAALTDCAFKVKDLTKSQVKSLFDLLILMIGSGRIKMAYTVKDTLKLKEYKKVFEWKSWIEEAKRFLVTVGTLPFDKLESTERRDCDEILRELRDITETLLEMFKKAKILSQIKNEHVRFIFDCMEVAYPHKCELAYKASDDEFLVLASGDKDLVDEILERVDKMLKQTDIQWNVDSAGTVQNLLLVVIESYDGNGKNVTESQNARFLSIFGTCCEGESLDDKLIRPEDEDYMSVYIRLYSSALVTYLALNSQSKTLSRCVPVVKQVLKWGRIAYEEDHDLLMTTSFGALQLVSLDMSPGLADITPEVVDFFLAVDKVSDLTNILRSLYPLNPEAVHLKLQSILDKLDDVRQTERLCIAAILNEVAAKHPEQFTETQIEKLIDLAAKEDQGVQVMFVNIVNQIAARCPENVCCQYSKLQNDSAFQSSSLIFRVMTIVRIACYDKKLTGSAIDFTVKHLKTTDQIVLQQILHQLALLARNDREHMEKYKKHLENLEKSSTTPEVKESCRNIINFVEGKSLEGVFEDIQQAQEDISDLDKKVDATMTTVIAVGDRVIEQDKDISKVKSDVDKIEDRVDVVEEDLGDTKVKVEEIDNKTMTNAPKWSRDLTKLLNPANDNDWHLLAKRLGYSNDDIRAWAQQNDPCMALLSEWYATHKTSEATFGLLTHLQEMNRQDAVVIVENAMKASEDVVEDEEFEYSTPPPIFLSYQWGIQNEVKLLKQHLNMAGYECWMDIGQMGGGDKLFNKIDAGVRAAKVIVCCTTEKYAQSPNCNREVNLSVNLGKPIIPLLMEKMAWPPKGSMGPIFSEYLFIRFFQRGGEESDDQRYWPLAKFQELLMQLNFHVVPDQSLIKPAYANWWMPIVEEIEIKKDKSKTDNSKKSSDSKNDVSVDVSPVVFLSYQWGKQPQVKALYQRLVSLGYTVWMDIFQMGGGDSLYDKIDRGMRGCKVVVACVTTKYALSANCRREMSLADALKKPLVPLLFESMKWPPDGPMSMIFTELLYINVFRDEKIQDNWTGPKFDELKEKLRQHVPDGCLAGGKDDPGDASENVSKAGKTEVKSPKQETAQAKEQETSKPTSEAQSVTNRAAVAAATGVSRADNGKRQEQKNGPKNDSMSDVSSNSKAAKSKSCNIL